QEEILGESLDELITTDEKLPEAEGITRQTQRGESVHVVTRRCRKDRSPVDVEIHGVPLVIHGEVEAIFGIYKDVTREVTLEGQLRQAQKMEAIGQLAGGIAHDFSNLLTGIRWHAEFAARGLPTDNPIRRDLAEVQRAADSAASLTRQLLAFGRRQVLQPVDLMLNDVITDLHMMLYRTLGEHVELELLPDPDLGTVHVDPGQIEQVILNLCLNARDAMPANGGKITLRTRNVHLDEEYCAANLWAREGRFVVLSVADTGHGMDDETRSHIFEPFFTTKEVGTGTGLGLATVYGIVQQHQGLIHVTSEPGIGSTFEIYLPLVERGVTKLTELLPESVGGGGGETILMAEDDEIVSRPVSRLLRERGYEVLLARDGAEAVRLFEAHAERIALVFLDMVMPVMGGAAVREKILEIRPDTRFLLTTGYSVETDGRSSPGPETPWLIKPYPPATLLQKVREILDA
ncbi:MAG: response regulator, partial [bacterium]|nr:response regulator [bacterium]